MQNEITRFYEDALSFPGTGGGLTESQKQAAAIRKQQASGGTKDDTDKIQMELIPSELLIAAATVLTFEARGLGRDDRSKGKQQ